MRTKLIAAGAAIALAATIGSASAADQFITMEGIEAQALPTQEMGGIYGANYELFVNNLGLQFGTPAPIGSEVHVEFIDGASAGLANHFIGGGGVAFPSCCSVTKFEF